MLEQPIIFNTLTFNDRVAAQTAVGNGTFQYYIHLVTADGLWGDEIRFESHPLPCDMGEWSGEALRSGKQIVLTGGIIAANLAALREAQWEVMEACWDLQAHQLIWTPWNLKGADSLYYTCKVNQPLSMAEETTALGMFKRQWTVGLRADDPRSYKFSDDSVYPIWQV